MTPQDSLSLSLSLLRDAKWFDRSRARDYTRFIFLISLPGLVLFYLIGSDVIVVPGRATGIDFISFWSAAHLALTQGPALGYDRAAMIQTQGLGDHFVPFPYPPPFLAVVLPFGLLAFRWALALWMAVTFAAYFVSAKRLLPGSPWIVAAFPPAFVSSGYGQNGGLSGALYAGIALLLDRRPFVAGMLVGGLVCKPQLAVLIPVAFLAGRKWRAIAGAAVSSIAILLASLIAFGPDTYRAFLAGASISWLTLNYAPLWPKMVGLYPSIRMLGVGATPALVSQLVLGAVCAVIVWRTWSRPGDTMAKIAVLVVAGLLATPYSYVYDLVMLIVPLCWLIREGMKTGFLPWEKFGLAVVYASAPFAALLAARIGFNGWWTVLAGFLAMLLRRQPAHRLAQVTLADRRPI